MSLYDDLLEALPELQSEDFAPNGQGLISLKDDGDGIAYIAKWEHSLPIPEGFKIGK